MAAKPGKVLPDQWYLGMPALQVNTEQLGDARWRKVKSFGIQIRRLGKPAYRCLHSMHFAIAALEDPFQHPAVLAVSGPQKLAVVIRAKPVNVKNLGQLGARPLADLEKVGKVIAHVVAAERQHSHRVTAKFADLAGGGRSCFAAHNRT